MRESKYLEYKENLTSNTEQLTKDILKTLELYSDQNGFNNAAALLADNNHFKGIDIIRFGDSIDEIMERKTFENISILSQMEQSIQTCHQIRIKIKTDYMLLDKLYQFLNY